jgi:pyruvate/2-oxoglutarate dehydrogenase complex dihydrolipoamide acyltransferase (E2) component
MKNRPKYDKKDFPLLRRMVIDSVRIGKRKNTVMGFLEMDITDAKKAIKEINNQSSKRYSLTAYIMACVSRAVEENKILHGYRNLWGKIILFHEVDITSIVEIETDGEKFPYAHIVRNCNNKSLGEISRELKKIKDRGDGVLKNNQSKTFFKIFLHLPAFIRTAFYWISFKFPTLFKKNAGTVLISSFGMYGSGAGWGMGYPIYTLGVFVGSISQKLVIVENQFQEREMIHLTLTFDHDIIDGAPAARFSNRLRELIESCHLILQQE